MFKIKVYDKYRVIRKNMIQHHAHNHLECTYRNHQIYIVKHKGDDSFYVQVTAPDGCYIVQGGYGGQYEWRRNCETLEDCLQICLENILL